MDCLKDIMNASDKIDILYKYTPMFELDKYKTDYDIIALQKERERLQAGIDYYNYHIIEYGHKLDIIQFNNSITVCNKYENELMDINKKLLYKLKNYNSLIQDDLLKIKRNTDMRISMMDAVIDYKMGHKVYIADSNFMYQQYIRKPVSMCIYDRKNMILNNKLLKKIIYGIKI